MAHALRTADRALRRLHWIRGLRAGVAVAGAMIVCHLFSDSIGWASGWAALGGFEAILVDNGGPYRSRFATIATLLVGGTLACIAASGAVGPRPVAGPIAAVLITAVFCFAATFARVIAQPIASTSVIILVIYFAALGSSAQSLPQALSHALAFVLGGGWAALLSLLLWPVDPFRPARLAIAHCYRTLAVLPSTIEPTERGSEAREMARTRAFEWQRQMRGEIESARAALAATGARAPSRTTRARNLTVLLETADMLLAVTMRTTELALAMNARINPYEKDSLRRFVLWLSQSEKAISSALQERPARGAVPEEARGENEGNRVQPKLKRMEAGNDGRASVLAHLDAAELDAVQNIEIACEAVKAVWTGVEAPAGTSRLTTAMASAVQAAGSAKPQPWVDALRAHWTLDSVMMRHALRMTVVAAADVLLLRLLHLSHGFWLGMTSIIVLQPYQSHTLKRGVQRVSGTVAGGVLAALLAAAISSQAGIMAVITLTSVLTLATYAVDYAWYCFFLTPTFVLMSLPHLHDWRFSWVRILTTMLGAAMAVAAMRLLWPEREYRALGTGLARAASADAAYIRATLRYWLRPTPIPAPKAAAPSDKSAVAEDRRLAEREILAPARRACGLASNDLEESLDRVMLESGFVRSASASAAVIEDHALTFATYIRRLTQSVTTLGILGRPDRETITKLEQLAGRMEAMSLALLGGEPRISAKPFREKLKEHEADTDIAVHQMQRIERQVSILEGAAAGVIGDKAVGAEPAIEASLGG